MKPRWMRSEGAVCPDAPRAEAGTIAGKRALDAARRRKRRRGIFRGVSIIPLAANATSDL
jgi:hypothetical protein